MIFELLMVLVGYLAVVGLVQVCTTLGRWMTASGELGQCWLVVTARPKEPRMEAKLRQAWSQVMESPGLDGVHMAVADFGADGETLQICRCFCREKGVPLAAPGELEELLWERRQEE